MCINFNNIQYELVSNKTNSRSKTVGEEIKVTVWRAFGIGLGQSFHWSKLNTPTVAAMPIQTGARYDDFQWQVDSVAKGTASCSLPIYSNFGLL